MMKNLDRRKFLTASAVRATGTAMVLVNSFKPSSVKTIS